MDSDTVQHVKARSYWPFMPLFFAAAGWALLHVWLFEMQANFRGHLLTVILGGALSGWSSLCPASDRNAATSRNAEPGSASPWALASGSLVLLAMGGILGVLVANGSLFLLGVLAAPLGFMPWARMPFSRHFPAASFGIAGGGFASAVLIRFHAIDIMFLPLAAWVFWLCAFCCLVLRAEQSRRAEREARANNRANDNDIRPAISDT